MAKFCEGDSGCYVFDQLQPLKNSKLTVTSKENKSSCKVSDPVVWAAGADTSAAYESATRPEGCAKCDATGTMFMTPTAGTAPTINNNMYIDGVKLSAGVVTFYVTVDAPGVYNVAYSAGDYGDSANFDTWVNVLDVATAGSYKVTFNLTDAPSSTTGTGWSPSTTGVYQSVIVDPVTAPAEVGVSTFSYYEGLDDLKGNVVINLECLQSFGNDFEAEVTEQICGGSTYNTNSTDRDLEFQAIKASRDPNILAPNNHKVRDLNTSHYTTTTLTASAYTDDNGTEFATLQVSDIAQACDQAVGVLLKDDCGATELDQISVSGGVKSMDKDSFILLDGSTGSDDKGRILLDSSYTDKTFCVNYPQLVVADAIVTTTEFKDVVVDAQFKRSYVKNGKKVTSVINFTNLLIRSVAEDQSTDASEGWTISATATAGANGTIVERFTI